MSGSNVKCQSLQTALKAKKWLYIDKFAPSNGMIMGPHKICTYFAGYGLTTLAQFIYPEIAQEQFLGK